MATEDELAEGSADSDSSPSGETPSSETAVAEPQEFKLSIDVAIEDIGPCKKHVRITIPRADITHIYGMEVGGLISSADVPGFRMGHAPKQLIEKRYRGEIDGKVKQRLLLDSLEQLADEDRLDPINQPNIDVDDIEIPAEGDFEYEFDVEVRPDFDLPEYKGLKLRRPVKEITESDVQEFLDRYLSQYGELEECDGTAELNDFVTLSVEFTHEERLLRKLSDLTVQVKPSLRFTDAELSGFDELIVGSAAGDTRQTDLTISTEVESIELRGETVNCLFQVKSVRRMKLPEMNSALLNRIGVDNEEELREEIWDMLERQALYQQRQAVREQVLDKITESADWDLPEQLVLNQVDNALRREILEMQQAGFTTQEIQSRENELRQNAVTTTRRALKEHFVLDKIAEQEKIEVNPSDIENEISMMALQRGESPRRVRARLIKSGMIENLEAQIRERQAVDVILDGASFDDYEPEEKDESDIEAVPHSVCGLSAGTSGETADEQSNESEVAAAEVTDE